MDRFVPESRVLIPRNTAMIRRIPWRWLGNWPWDGVFSMPIASSARKSASLP